uniref:Uncharacterized protein n=1 Tax=Mustela putorius furo TaxID=9669 RepID=M3Y119_MUSPF
MHVSLMKHARVHTYDTDFQCSLAFRSTLRSRVPGPAFLEEWPVSVASTSSFLPPPPYSRLAFGPVTKLVRSGQSRWLSPVPLWPRGSDGMLRTRKLTAQNPADFVVLLSAPFPTLNLSLARGWRLRTCV